MLILALDTSSPTCTAVLWRNGEVLARGQYEVGRKISHQEHLRRSPEDTGQKQTHHPHKHGHCGLVRQEGETSTFPKSLPASHLPVSQGFSEVIAPLCASLFEEAGLSSVTPDRLAVVTGPGSFTGLRAGLSFARGMALALHVPCLGFFAFDLLARQARQARLVVAHDARRGGVYWQGYEKEEARGMPKLQPPSEAMQNIKDWAGDKALSLAGSGASLLAGEERWQDLNLHTPDSILMAAWAAKVDPQDHPPRPVYIRPPDAQPMQTDMPRVL